VTKTYGPEAAASAWSTGIRALGENRIQEALEKMDQVPEPVEWHLIGHLQRNKVKHLDRFAMFHALDSERLANAVSERGIAAGRRMPVLVQVNTSGEETKGGFDLEGLREAAPRLAALGGLEIRGTMTMAPYEAPETVLREVFGRCREAAGVLREAGLESKELSMGMSGDYEVAVEEGATMVRLGTILFGERTP
jgi:pyridoxal phosphate enzyme (YggS family)